MKGDKLRIRYLKRGEWCDKDYVMQYAMMECVSRFLEEEDQDWFESSAEKCVELTGIVEELEGLMAVADSSDDFFLTMGGRLSCYIGWWICVEGCGHE